MSNSKENFRQNVWAELKKRGWDQADLAAEAHYSLSSIRKTMSGARFSYGAVEAIAGALKRTSSQLMATPTEFSEIQKQDPAYKKIGEMTPDEFQSTVLGTSFSPPAIATLIAKLSSKTPEGDILLEIMKKLSLASLDQLKMALSGVEAALDESDIGLNGSITDETPASKGKTVGR